MTTAAIPTAGAKRGVAAAGVLIGVLGVVYGDIGTSPLYAVRTSLLYFGTRGFAAAEVMGVLSLIFWSLVIVVTVKYVLVIMHADNRGEGGIVALMALAQRVAPSPRMRLALGLTGLAGACLFLGDGMITPAISVLSALEGLEVVSPALKEFVLPLAVVVIILLFVVQVRGTGSVGRVFGPVMTLWFLCIGLLGILEIVRHPFVLLAVSPSYGVVLFINHGTFAFEVLGAVVLAVTGAEALYADMGHFGAEPIRMTWLFFVLPALVLNYFGQGALLLAHPLALQNPFFLLGPRWAQLPLVVLATMATVIASQAVISGAFSLARQAMQLGFLPRMTVRHTSETEEGQIYVPQINAGLALGVLFLVLAFKTSDSLASAYGIAVTGTFICTSLLAAVVFRRHFGWSTRSVAALFGLLVVVDLGFFSANLLKVPDGGWVPLVIGIALFALMTSWQRGRALMFSRWQKDSLPIGSFLGRLPQSRIVRVPGIAIFLTGNPDYVPAALLHNLKHNKVLHERVLLVTVNNLDVPEVDGASRVQVEQLQPGIWRVTIRYGFKESPDIPRELARLPELGVDFEPMQASYFLGREMIVPAMVPKMPWWRLWLFLVMARNAVSATEFFRIPSDRVVELGVRVAI